jgi:hypothetical protein
LHSYDGRRGYNRSWSRRHERRQHGGFVERLNGLGQRRRELVEFFDAGFAPKRGLQFLDLLVQARRLTE